MKYHLLLIISTLLIFSACRKGEDDPFLSLRSRKARLAGDWTLSTATFSEKSDGYEVRGEYSNGVEIRTFGSGNDVDTLYYTKTLEISKKGTYALTNTGYPNYYYESGNWIFYGKSKNNDLKNKEAIFLNITYTKDSDTFASSGFFETQEPLIVIRRLSKDEMIWDIHYSTYSESSEYTYTYTYTWKKN